MFMLSEFLKDYAKEHNITQKELAERIGTPVNTLRNWMSCKNFPTMDVTQVVLCKLGYEVIVKEKSDKKSSLAYRPISSFNAYEKAIYDRGRSEALKEITHKVKPVLEDIAAY